MPSRLFYLSLWTGPFLIEGVSEWFLLLPCIIEIPIFNANTVDPDQTPQNAASDQGLHCLPMSHLWDITKTCLYNFDPLKPHVYIVKLGFTGVYMIFLISAKNIDCGYSLEPPRWGGSNEYPQSMFLAEIWKISEFFIWKFSVYLNRLVLVMARHKWFNPCHAE